MKRHVAILLSALLLLMFAARAQTIALQTDPPLYIVESYPDNWESCCDLVDADGNVVQAHWADSVVRNDEVLIIRQNGLIGYMGYDGNWLAEPQFDDVRNFSEGMAAVQVGGLFGYIDSNYAWVVSPMFDEANLFSGGMAAVKKEGLWGYVDAAGSLVIAPKFDEAGGFSGDYAVVREGGRYGVIDRTGAFRCPPTYERLSLFCDGAFKTEDGGLVVLLDETAEYLSSQTYGRFESGKNGLIKVEKKGLYGLINLRGDVVLKPKYAQIDDYNDCCAIVVYNEIGILGKIQSGLRTLKGMGDYFIVNLQGERLSEEGFWTAAIQGDGVISAENRNGSHLFGFVDGVMREVQAVDSPLNLADYAPFEGQKNAAGAVREDIGFDAAHALPRLDGATALFPVYAAFAQAVYPEDTRYTPYNRSDSADSLLTCSKTDRAYERLIYGNTDVIFCAQPSDEEIQMAKEAGVELELTPIGYEAFVFIVPREEPVTGLTTQNIRDIYRGAVTDWAELGIEGLGKIVAYQRPENSGSQTALEKIMGDLPLMDAPGYVVDDMVGIVDNVEYRNLPGAIGYSFRYFVSGMMESDVRMLAIDGIEPALENIRNGSYPFISTLYAVTRRGEANPNVQTLLSWLTGDTAQRLLEASGYVGLN